MATETHNPPLYRDPVALHAQDHADWHLTTATLEYASDENALPLMLEEFARASRHYPIVFAGEAGMPVALMGLVRHNGFIEAGRWRGGHYIPAYLRRYPFLLMELDAAEDGMPRSLLAIDREAPQVSSTPVEGGIPLFVDGEPAPVIAQALRFCADFTAAHAATVAWVQALREKELLVSRQADFQVGDGEARSLAGFSVIDIERFAALDAPTVVDWHRKGWLGAVHHHIASLQAFETLAHG